VIATIIVQIANGARTIKLGALTPTRDFNFVSDTVAAFSAALGAPRVCGEIINVGSNFEISIGDTAAMIARLMRADITVAKDQLRLRPATSEVERLWASNDKARRLLGWSPAFGGLDGLSRGLSRTIEWFSDPENSSSYRADEYAV
jgi:nucleoside-diphosphate-sugar epimerase